LTIPVHALIIAPHPDDAEFGIAGTVARWTGEGKPVAYVMVTNGDKGTSERNLKPEEIARIRETEQRNAAAILGVSDIVFLNYPDQGVEDTADFRKELVRWIRHYQPYLVATSDPYRKYIWHRDHRITGQVVLDAIFPYARDHLAYPDLLAQGLEPHKVKEILFWGSEDINLRVDVTETFSRKIDALFAHTSQVGHYGRENLEARMRERYRTLAEGENFELAEAFHRVEILR